jgi:hypothetical protein
MNPNIAAFFEKVQNSSELQQKQETIEATANELDESGLDAVSAGNRVLINDMMRVGGYISSFFRSSSSTA